ncbi:hypothetical protein GN244_ATG15007 [Phytophthora infestans]|uniref:Uncharacterized protein n=1 Tax=Phytophthora infestans TaxID=4787 RepID=A0A833S549_PHYIN|nr:hypothetical protein GN244_ATG15007 [Phytophthora infestans]
MTSSAPSSPRAASSAPNSPRVVLTQPDADSSGARSFLASSMPLPQPDDSGTQDEPLDAMLSANLSGGHPTPSPAPAPAEGAQRSAPDGTVIIVDGDDDVPLASPPQRLSARIATRKSNAAGKRKATRALAAAPGLVPSEASKKPKRKSAPPAPTETHRPLATACSSEAEMATASTSGTLAAVPSAPVGTTSSAIPTTRRPPSAPRRSIVYTSESLAPPPPSRQARPSTSTSITGGTARQSAESLVPRPQTASFRLDEFLDGLDHAEPPLPAMSPPSASSRPAGESLDSKVDWLFRMVMDLQQ